MDKTAVERIYDLERSAVSYRDRVQTRGLFHQSPTSSRYFGVISYFCIRESLWQHLGE